LGKAKREVKRLVKNRSKIEKDLKKKQQELKIIEGKMKRYAKKYPMRALGIAAAAGALVGATYKVLRRKRR